MEILFAITHISCFSIQFLQQLSIDEVNSYVSNAVGNRKLSNSEVETAIQVAMQNVAAGADPADELKTVQDVQDAQ